MTNSLLSQLLEVNAVKINGLLSKLNAENSLNRINAQTATAGFYMRHIAEAQIMLSFNFFETNKGLPYSKPLTLGVSSDEGQLFDVTETAQLMAQGTETLKEVIQHGNDEYWNTEIETKFFGKITRINGLGRILNHNAHHCGQIELCLKKPM
jgi:hypothetical protein